MYIYHTGKLINLFHHPRAFSPQCSCSRDFTRIFWRLSRADNWRALERVFEVIMWYIFCRNIGFYSDGISSVYKTQPLSNALASRGRVWRQFKTRVIKTLYNIYVDYINNIITSMPTRMHAVLQADGFRIKYWESYYDNGLYIVFPYQRIPHLFA